MRAAEERLPAAAPEGYRIDLPLAAAELAGRIAALPWTGLFVAFDYGKVAARTGGGRWPARPRARPENNDTDLVVVLAAGENHLIRVDDDDVVAVVDMRREGRLVLAAQTQRDERGEPADDEALGVDQYPVFLTFCRLGQCVLPYIVNSWKWAFAEGHASTRPCAVRQPHIR